MKSGGCAVILSIIADLPHTRPSPLGYVQQAALAHLESIIYNPFEANDIQDEASSEQTQTQSQRVISERESTETR